MTPFPHLTGINVTDDGRALASIDNVDIYNGLRAMVIKAVALIPEVGSAISALLGFFWPTKKRSVWDQIKDQVQAMIDKSMLERELQQRSADLLGYQTTLQRYATAKNTERAGYLPSVITEADNIYAKLTTSAVKEQILPITVAFSLLHIGVLAEQYNHGQLIFGEDNRMEWRKELNDQYENYRAFFAEQYDAWHTFRSRKIRIAASKTTGVTVIPPFFYWIAVGKARDELTGASINYEKHWTDSTTYYRQAVQSIKDMWMSRAVADMAAAMTPFFLLHRMLPGHEQDAPQVLPKLQNIWMGPYTVTTLAISDSSKDYVADILDKPGEVKSWYVRESNSIDYQQLRFASHDGKGVGNAAVGNPHTVTLPGGAHFTGCEMLWENGLLVSVNLHRSDGTTTGELGNRGKWSGKRIHDVVAGGLYHLDAAAYRIGYGPSRSKGTGLLKHRFSIPNATWQPMLVVQGPPAKTLLAGSI